MKYCGIDLHGNNVWVVIIDEADRALYSKLHANDLVRLLVVPEAYRVDLQGIVVESTFNWYWPVDGLQLAGYRVLLANTAAIKQYEGLKHRGDESDARQLAHLLRLGLLPQGHIMPKAVRAIRDLARKRMQLGQPRLPGRGRQHRQRLILMGDWCGSRHHMPKRWMRCSFARHRCW